MRMAALCLFLSLFATGCPRPQPHATGTPSGAVCTPGSTLTYDTFGRSFMEQYCTRCHASTVTGAARNTAPVGVDFDTLAGIEENVDRIDAQAASGASRVNLVMPPSGPFPSASERADLGVWLACGAP
jgi:uncharacterized membrane protein